MYDREREIKSGLKVKLVRGIASLVLASGLLRILMRFSSKYRFSVAGENSAGRAFLRRRAARSVQILLYHQVNDEQDYLFPGVPVDVFAKHMSFLAEYAAVLPLDEAVERMRKRDVPENAVVITFDDGYKDNYLNAFPVLKSLSLPATIFLATDVIGTGRILWHDHVFSAFRETQEVVLEGFDGTLPPLSLVGPGERLHALTKVLMLLRCMNEPERLAWIDRLVECLNVPNCSIRSELMLDWDNVREMARGRVTFGSHTVSHPIMSRISDDEARTQVLESAAAIRRQLGVTPRTFAYPNGTRDDFTPATKEILKDAGFNCAVTTIFGTNEAADDPFELKRGTPWEEDLPMFAAKLSWYRLGFQ